MKKTIFVFILGILMIFLFTKDAKAACSVQPLVRNGCGSEIGCYSGGTLYCCTYQSECDKILNPVSKNPGGGVVPASNIQSDVTCGTNGIDTAIGCIPVLGGQEEFLGFLLKWAIGVGGGIAFLLIVYAGFMIMTASGNPERLKAGQELITSAISGLVLLIFSIFVLNFIGVDILGLCKFGFGKAC